MARHTSLRSVSMEKPAEKHAHDIVPVTREFGSIMSTLGSMERLIEDAFRRPFFGMNWLPFRDLIRDYGMPGEVSYYPTVDVYEHGNEVKIRCELPGMKRDEINVKFLDANTLVLSGERKFEEKVEKGEYLRHECSCGVFSRTLSLPEGCDYEKAKASYRDGILEIAIPKTEETTRKGWTVPIE